MTAHLRQTNISLKGSTACKGDSPGIMVVTLNKSKTRRQQSIDNDDHTRSHYLIGANVLQKTTDIKEKLGLFYTLLVAL